MSDNNINVSVGTAHNSQIAGVVEGNLTQINESQPRDLAEVAEEIQRLLDTLSETYGTETPKQRREVTN